MNKYAMNVQRTLNGGTLIMSYEPGFKLNYHAAEPELYKPTLEQLYPLGTSYEIRDQKFRYVKAETTALSGGQSAGILAMGDQDNVVAALAGATEVLYTGSDISDSGRYHGGYLSPPVGAVEAPIVPIREIIRSENKIVLDEPMPVALAAGNNYILVPNPWMLRGSSLVTHVGVSLVDVSLGNYGWVCTNGLVRVRVDSSVSAGDAVYAQADGRFDDSDGSSDPVGEFIVSGVAANNYCIAKVWFE